MKSLASRVMATFVFFFMSMCTTAWAADTFNSNKTDFETFTAGASVDGQGGWVKTGPYDEEVVNDGGNIVWRVSNAITTGNIEDQPFAPRPGGVLMDTVNDPVNSNPQFFAGESSTGADFDRFLTQLDFKSATGAPQPGLSLTISPDNGQGARQGFVDILDNGAGLEIVTFDVDVAGGFIGPIVIASGLSYTETHSLSIEITFIDGPANDVVKYFVNGELVHTGTSWEQFYTNFQPLIHPLGVPVQTLIFAVLGAAQPAVDGGGYFIDNVVNLVGQNNPDHFQCYNVNWSSKLRPRPEVSLNDQFGYKDWVRVGKRAVKYCTPVDKNGEGIDNPDVTLTCYRVKKKALSKQVVIENQFGEQTLMLKESRLLCVPSSQLSVTDGDYEEEETW